MVAVPEDNHVSIVIFDSSKYPSPPKKETVTMALTDTCSDLRNTISEKLGYTKDSFDLKVGNITLTNEQQTIHDIREGKPKFTVFLTRRPGTTNSDFNIKKDDEDGEATEVISHNYGAPYGPSYSSASGSSALFDSSHPSASGFKNFWNTPSSYNETAVITHPTVTNYAPSSSSSSMESSPVSYNFWNRSTTAGKASSGFVGLSNQGATCYMNSLIQTLYMTPEFREAVYKWNFEENYLREKKEKLEKEKAAAAAATTPAVPAATVAVDEAADRTKKESNSIPLQLQRLFARLQLCDQQAVKTKDLTKSFGWEDADAFTQHDVQELCRVLFDALEKNFKGTKQANLVNELYQGKMKDYVRCKECNNESARTDEYLDIPLVIRGFGETKAVRSVEEAMNKFVQPEILDGDNQYKCEKCNKKVDAVKGLKIIEFPYLLTFQLKRFDFDFQSMKRVKLNDKVTFPAYLDLNKFILEDPAAGNNLNHNNNEKEKDSKEKVNNNDAVHSFNSDGERDSDSSDDEVASNNTQDSAYDVEPDLNAPAPEVTKEKPYIYELYSVLIHRGSSMGGHYYAYIKSFDNNKWYEFNDSSVTEITIAEVKKAFGGDEDGGSSVYRSAYSFRSNANAYMLMYRRIDPKNVKKVETDMIPEAVKKVLSDEDGQAKQKKALEEQERDMIKLKIHYEGAEKPLTIHKNTAFKDTTKAAAELFGLEKANDLKDIRLRAYSLYNELPGETYNGREEMTMDQLHFFYSIYTTKSMLLEVKKTEEVFGEWNPNDMLFRIQKYDAEKDAFEPQVSVYAPKHGTFGNLKTVVEAQLGIPVAEQRFFKEASAWQASAIANEITDSDETDLSRLHFSEPEKLYVERYNPAESIAPNPFKSPAFQAIAKIKNTIEVKFNLPGKEEADQKVIVDKNILLRDFKKLLEPILGLSSEEFKVKKGLHNHLELVTEEDTLADLHVKNGTQLIVEKGRPLKEGETVYTLNLVDLTKAETFSDLFDITLHEARLVSDVKKEIAERLQKEKNITINPEHMRLRDFSNTTYSRRLGKVFPDAQTLKKAMQSTYPRNIGVQDLGEPESVLDEADLGVFVHLFKPSTFELGPRLDFTINEDTSIEQTKEKLGRKFGIDPANVGFVKIDSFYNWADDFDLLDVPTMHWNRPVVNYSTKDTISDRFMARNGNLFLVRDETEQLKELTKEEKDAIVKEANKKKHATQSSSTSINSYWNRKEKALKIQAE